MSVRRGLAPHVRTDYREAIPRVAELGLDFVELAMEGDNDRWRVRQEASEIHALASADGLDLVVHLPFALDLTSPHHSVRQAAREEYEEAIETATAIGAKKGVLRAHSGAYRPAYDDETLRNRFVEMALDLDSYAEHAGLDLCVENRGGLITLQEGFPRLFENDVSMCLDTACARRAGLSATEQAALLLERGEQISHVHLSDVSERGQRVPFGEGRIDFERLLEPVTEWDGSLALARFDRPGDPSDAVERLEEVLASVRRRRVDPPR